MSTHYTTTLTATGDVMINRASGPRLRAIDLYWLGPRMAKVIPAGHPLRRMPEYAPILLLKAEP